MEKIKVADSGINPVWKERKESFYLMTHSTHFIILYLIKIMFYSVHMVQKVELKTPTSTNVCFLTINY